MNRRTCRKASATATPTASRDRPATSSSARSSRPATIDLLLTTITVKFPLESSPLLTGPVGGCPRCTEGSPFCLMMM